MARSLLVAPADEEVGLARTCLGLLRALDRSGVHVDYVKPVAQPRADGAPDRSAALVAVVSTLRPLDRSAPPTGAAARRGRPRPRPGEIVAAWAPIYNWSDVVVVEGLKAGPSRLYATALNQALARPRRRRPAGRQLVRGADGVEGLAEQFAIAASGYASATPRAWSAAWSMACPRPIPRWFSRLRPPRPARRPPPCGPRWTAPAPADRRGAAPAGADLAACRRHGPRAEPRDPARGRPVPADQGRGGVRPGYPGRHPGP